MSLPSTIDPRFHVESDLAQARIDYIVRNAYNPGALYPACETCGNRYELKRCSKSDSNYLGCFFVTCSTRNCGQSMWLKWNKDKILALKLSPAWNNLLLFEGFPDKESVNPAKIPKVPGYKEPVFPTAE